MNDATEHTLGDTLLVGIGNTLRRDDGVGAWIVERIRSRDLPGIRCQTVHQLTPELAELLASHRRTLFVDACRSEDEVRLRKVIGASDSIAVRWNHVGSTESLLLLAQRLYGRIADAWLLTIPGSDFGFGEELSDECRDAARWGLRVVEKWVNRDPWRRRGQRTA